MKSSDLNQSRYHMTGNICESFIFCETCQTFTTNKTVAKQLWSDKHHETHSSLFAIKIQNFFLHTYTFLPKKKKKEGGNSSNSCMNMDQGK